MKVKIETGLNGRFRLFESVDLIKNQSLLIQRIPSEKSPQCDRCVTVSKKFGSKCTEIQLSIVKAESKTLSYSQLRIYSNLPPKWSKVLREILEKEAKPSVFAEYQ